MNATEKYVATTTLTEFGWRNTHALPGNLVDGVRGLKVSGEGDIAILGSGVLVRALLQEGLIDTLRLFVHPLVLGSGKRLFGDLVTPRHLTLKQYDATPMGTIILSYDIASDPS